MSQLFKLGTDFAELQRQETETEKQRLLDSGMQYINILELQDLLKKIGLKLCLNKNNYFHAYYNNLNENNYLEATTQPLDSKGISVYNIQSEFYQKELKGDFRGEKGEKLYRLRDNYFTTIKVGKKEYILSF